MHCNVFAFLVQQYFYIDIVIRVTCLVLAEHVLELAMGSHLYAPYSTFMQFIASLRDETAMSHSELPAQKLLETKGKERGDSICQRQLNIAVMSYTGWLN